MYIVVIYLFCVLAVFAPPKADSSGIFKASTKAGKLFFALQSDAVGGHYYEEIKSSASTSASINLGIVYRPNGTAVIIYNNNSSSLECADAVAFRGAVYHKQKASELYYEKMEKPGKFDEKKNKARPDGTVLFLKQGKEEKVVYFENGNLEECKRDEKGYVCTQSGRLLVGEDGCKIELKSDSRASSNAGDERVEVAPESAFSSHAPPFVSGPVSSTPESDSPKKLSETETRGSGSDLVPVGGAGEDKPEPDFVAKVREVVAEPARPDVPISPVNSERNESPEDNSDLDTFDDSLPLTPAEVGADPAAGGAPGLAGFAYIEADINDDHPRAPAQIELNPAGNFPLAAPAAAGAPGLDEFAHIEGPGVPDHPMAPQAELNPADNLPLAAPAQPELDPVAGGAPGLFELPQIEGDINVDHPRISYASPRLVPAPVVPDDVTGEAPQVHKADTPDHTPVVLPPAAPAAPLASTPINRAQPAQVVGQNDVTTPAKKASKPAQNAKKKEFSSKLHWSIRGDYGFRIKRNLILGPVLEFKNNFSLDDWELCVGASAKFKYYKIVKISVLTSVLKQDAEENNVLVEVCVELTRHRKRHLNFVVGYSTKSNSVAVGLAFGYAGFSAPIQMIF
jgi:hypothetical protein